MSHESCCTANIIIFGLTFIPLMKITRMLLQYLDYWIVCEIHIQEGTLKKRCFIQRCPWSCQFTQKQLINFTNFWWEAPWIKEWRPELPCLRWSWNREKISFHEINTVFQYCHFFVKLKPNQEGKWERNYAWLISCTAFSKLPVVCQSYWRMFSFFVSKRVKMKALRLETKKPEDW